MARTARLTSGRALQSPIAAAGAPPNKGDHRASCNDRNRLCRSRLRCVLRRLRARCGLRRHRRGQDRPTAAEYHADLRAGARRSGRKQRQGGPPEVRCQRGRGRRRCRRGVPRRRDALAARRRPCGPVLRLRRGRGDRPADPPLHGGRDQIHRPRRHRRRGRGDHPQGRARCRVRRRLEPRVPPRRRRDRRLQAAGPHRGRHPVRPRCGTDARALSPAVPQRDPAGGDRPAHRGADQVRGQRVPRDEDHLHQRDRGPVREGRRQRPARRERDRARQADRSQVPQRRPRLWRLVLPEGHARPVAHGGDVRRTGVDRRRRHRRQRPAQGARRGLR